MMRKRVWLLLLLLVLPAQAAAQDDKFLNRLHGEWQGEAVRTLLAEDGWRAAATHPDLTMRDRATTAVRL